MVEVAHVDAELERAGRDDDAVLALGERALGVGARAEAERAVEDVAEHAGFVEPLAELLGLAPRVGVDEALPPRMERADDLGRVVEAAHEVDREVRARAHAAGIDDARGPLGAALHPAQDLGRIPHGGAQADALEIAPGIATDSLDQGGQMRASIVVGEGVNLVDDHRLQTVLARVRRPAVARAIVREHDHRVLAARRPHALARHAQLALAQRVAGAFPRAPARARGVDVGDALEQVGRHVPVNAGQQDRAPGLLRGVEQIGERSDAVHVPARWPRAPRPRRPRATARA